MNMFFSNIEVGDLKHELMSRFTILLSAFLLLLIFSYVVFLMAITAKEHDAMLFNLAGKQRMYIYKYASEVNQALIGLASSDLEMALLEKKKVDLTEKKFEEMQKILVDGGKIIKSVDVFSQGDGNDKEIINKVIDIPSITNEKIRTHIKHVNEEWLELKRVALLSLRSDTRSISKNRFVRQLLDQATKTALEMDHVVQMMLHDSEEKARHWNILLMVMISFGSVLFLMLIYYVYSRIVSPLDNSIGNLQRSMENLEVEKMRAEEANQAKSEFLSSMSHELRTPMNAILGFGQLLELDAEDLNEVQRDNVQEILNAGHHLLSLINDVLDLAKIESGKLEVSMEKVHIDDLLRQCIALIAAQAEARQLELIDHISCNGYIVSADFTRLKQVMLNLLSNAVKYNHQQGSITLDCEVTSEQRICIRVTDTGDGLTENEIAKLFNSFERLNIEYNVEGTGIGLVITKHLVELMGGKIGVESTPGKGSTFWVELALYKDA